MTAEDARGRDQLHQGRLQVGPEGRRLMPLRCPPTSPKPLSAEGGLKAPSHDPGRPDHGEEDQERAEQRVVQEVVEHPRRHSVARPRIPTGSRAGYAAGPRRCRTTPQATAIGIHSINP